MKNIIILIASSGLAQVIPIAISPILTRLYSPDEFGSFSLYAAIVAILSVIVTARYEQAIQLPRYNRDAIYIVVLSVFACVLISAFLFIVILISSSEISKILGNEDISRWLYLMPFSTLVIGVYQVLYYWKIRKSDYIHIAMSRTMQSTTSGGGQVTGGYFGVGMGGLVGGQLIAQMFSALFLFRIVYNENKKSLKSIKINKIIAIAKKYRNFPKYMMLGHLLNAASGYMPLFVIGALYGPTVAGFYALAQRVTITPLSLIGGAIGDIYRSEASKQYRENGNCLNLFKYTVFKLTIVSLIISVPIFFWGQKLFAMIFGSNWSGAGEIASILSIMIFFQSISSPTSETVLLGGLLKLDLVWQLFRLFLSLSSLYIGYIISPDNPSFSIMLYGLAFALLYILHSFMQYKVASGSIIAVKD